MHQQSSKEEEEDDLSDHGFANAEEDEELDPLDPMSFADQQSLAYRLIQPMKSLLETNEPIRITAFSDADFAGDTEQRRSTAGFVVYLNSTPLQWATKKVKCTMTSTFDVEFLALSEALKEVLYFRELTRSIGVEVQLPMTIYCDNLSAAYVASELSAESKARHVAVRLHHVRSYVDCGIIEVMHCNTEEMHADIFTKYLPVAQHRALTEKIMSNL